MSEHIGFLVHLRSELVGSRLPDTYMDPHIEASISPGTENREFDQVVPGFPAWFCTVRMCRACGQTHPVTTHFDPICMLVAEKMYTRHVVEMVAKRVRLTEPRTRMVAHSDVLNASLSYELEARGIDEYVTTSIGRA